MATGVKRQVGYKILNVDGGGELMGVSFALLFQGIVWVQVFLYQWRRAFFEEELGML